MQHIPPTVDLICFLPDDFLNKKINEPFVKSVLCDVLDIDDWKAGDPNKYEPDYFCGNIPVEITIASNTKKRDNFIQSFKRAAYSTVDSDADIFCYIKESIEKKLRKQYSVPNVHLCVLVLIAKPSWLFSGISPETEDLMISPMESSVSWIREKCIDSNKFGDVYLIFPDMNARWWLFSIKNSCTGCKILSDKEILDGGFPFWMTKENYCKMIRPNKDS